MEGPDRQVLIDIVTIKMPFGKYKNRLLCDLPIFYLQWFQNKEWPVGKLGILMRNVYEIKINGMEPLLKEIKHVIHH
ncbi:DUF3820 family protein [Portibacter marinus]|uniref:DUF3820 family protein n=1 Tax=Portibacter marinus TaxID=2898660 RepID=UPI001F422645|nr:DUF3820 family protein [Portibacter marinus]